MLTPRQVDVLRQVAAGAKSIAIADSLGIGYQTVLEHLREARHRLDAHNRAALVDRAHRAGLMYPEQPLPIAAAGWYWLSDAGQPPVIIRLREGWTKPGARVWGPIPVPQAR